MKLPRNLTGRTFAVIVVTVALYAILVALAGWDEFRDRLAAFPAALIVPLLLLSGANYVLRYWRWERYLRSFGVELPQRDSLVLYFASYVMVITPGKIGEVFKAGILRERFAVPLAIGLPVVLAERIFDFMAVLLLAAVGLLFWSGPLAGITTGLLVAALVPAALIALRTDRVQAILMAWATRTPLLRTYQLELKDSLESLDRLLAPRAAMSALAISTTAWACECVSFWLVCRGLELPVGVMPGFFVYAAGTLVGSLSFLPGGLGGTEATIIWLLTTLGIPAASGVSAAFIVRLATLWLAVLLGFAVFLPNRRFFLDAPQAGTPLTTGVPDA